MIGEKTELLIEDAVKEEKRFCIEKHGEFHNHHEAWAVMREELEEVEECFDPFNRIIASAMEGLWNLVRSDDVGVEAQEMIDKISERAMELTKECIQVLAMCDKWNDLIAKENEA